jgi:Prokaryotic E2 family E
MKPDVVQAIQEIRAAFNGYVVDDDPDDQGGAHVIIHDVPIGPVFKPAQTWIGFTIPFQYPDTDIYPHFIGGDVRRTDDGPYGQAISATTWRGRSALQLSRKSNQWNAATDTALLKLMQVLEWLKNR